MVTATVKSMPAIFIGHGNPMNILRQNRWTEGWKALGSAMPRPRAILAVSAHWYISSTMVTAMPHPRTIHDFGGFPQELYEITYPAPGDRALALRVQELLGTTTVKPDEEWGLDHGTWSVLYKLFPNADIPVVQLSINRPHFITKSENGWHLSGMKGFCFSGAAISCTTCRRISGSSLISGPLTGPQDSKKKSGGFCVTGRALNSSIMKSWGLKRSSPFRHRIITSPFSMFSDLVKRVKARAFPLRGLTEDRCRCLPYRYPGKK
jgi:hypothetical protein